MIARVALVANAFKFTICSLFMDVAHQGPQTNANASPALCASCLIFRIPGTPQRGVGGPAIQSGTTGEGRYALAKPCNVLTIQLFSHERNALSA